MSDELDRLRAELAEAHITMWVLADKVTRVRELCDDVDAVFRTTKLRRALLRDDILHALDGPPDD